MPWTAHFERADDGIIISAGVWDGDVNICITTCAETASDVTDKDVYNESVTRDTLLIASAKDLLELLDNVAAALDTVMAVYGDSMPPEDAKQRDDLVEKAQWLVAELRGEKAAP